MKMLIETERTHIPVGEPSKRNLMVQIEAPPGESKERLPVNVAVVIDRSGSMQGSKIERAKETAIAVIEALDQRDRVSIVAYDDAVEVILPSSPISSETVALAGKRIRRLEPGGTTDLSQGWLTGCEQIAEYLTNEDVGRCYLLSDGLANRGITERDELAHHAGELRKRGVSTSTFGIGTDFDEELLQRMAEAGGGNFYFVEQSEQIQTYVSRELGETLEVVAPAAYLRFICDDGIRIHSLNGFPAGDTRDGWQFELGSLVSQQLLDAVFSFEIPARESGSEMRASVILGHRGGVQKEDAFVYVPTEASTASAQPRNRRLDLAWLKLAVAQVRRQAVLANRDGRFSEAEEVIARTVEEISESGIDQALASRFRNDLERMRRRISRPLPARTRKAEHFKATAFLKGKNALGGSRKHGRPGERVGLGREIVVIPTSVALRSVCEEAVGILGSAGELLLGSIQVAFDHRLADQAARLNGNSLTESREQELVEYASRAFGTAKARLLVTTERLHNNWFSNWHSEHATGVASLADWRDLADILPATYLAYEILLNGLSVKSAQYDTLAIAHEETRGCLFDFVGDKRDIEVNLETMDLCPSCRHQLTDWGIDIRAVLRVCDRIRTHSVAA